MALRRLPRRPLEAGVKAVASTVPGKRFTPHMLRHTCVVWSLAQGARIEQVSEMLGHSSIQITYDIYGGLLDLRDTAVERPMAAAMAGLAGRAAATHDLAARLQYVRRPRSASCLGRGLQAEVREVAQVGIRESSDHESAVEEAVELLAAGLGKQRAAVAGSKVAGIWPLPFSPASMHTGSVEHQRASLIALAMTIRPRFSARAIRTRPPIVPSESPAAV